MTIQLATPSLPMLSLAAAAAGPGSTDDAVMVCKYRIVALLLSLLADDGCHCCQNNKHKVNSAVMQKLMQHATDRHNMNTAVT